MKTSSTRKKKTNTKKIEIIIGVCIAVILAPLIYFTIGYKPKASHLIVEGKTIEDIYKYIKPYEFNDNTLVVCDIDNTLIYPKTIIGSEQWFYARVEGFESQGMTTAEAVNAVLPQSFELLEYIPMEPVESSTVAVINDLQKRGVTVIALTARSLDLTYRTVDQLAQLGIHFNGKGPVQCPMVYGEGKPALYIEGILFCGSQGKGETLINWLTHIHYRPTKIIFIDDKMKNIIGVEQKLLPYQYQFIGIRYSYLDTHKAKISPEIIEKELEEFTHQNPDARPITDLPEETEEAA